MPSAALLGRLAAYAAFGGVLLLFSHAPRWSPLGEGMALVQVSIAHAGERLQACRRLSAAELAARAPNMRAPLECPRERSAVHVVVEIDGRTVLDETASPAGLSRDGAALVYRRIPVAAGAHRLRVQVQDDLRTPGQGAERSETVILDAGRILGIGYSAERGGILLL